MSGKLTRRGVLQLGLAGCVSGVVSDGVNAHDDKSPLTGTAPERRFLTSAKDFGNVSRGDPLPYTLKGEALTKARLTAETWRLEVTAEEKAEIAKPLRLADGTALDMPALLELGKKHAVRFLKAMQCTNIAVPLGQGLWEGVPVRNLLWSCGRINNARRLYYWGFHNNDPKQMFRSSMAMNQVLDSPPGELPPFLAYKLNGAPIPLERGGPVRMVVPWAHGFKSIKWLQNIVLTNRHENNDTYAEQNNDPESYLKTAAYFDDLKPESFAGGKPIVIRGTAMVGWPGLERVEYWLRPDEGAHGKLADDDPAWSKAAWQSGTIEPLSPAWASALPTGVQPKEVWGFTSAGEPREWPMRFCLAYWRARLDDVRPGKFELRVRTVDKNGFAQPEPRPYPKAGRNMIQCKLIEVK